MIILDADASMKMATELIRGVKQYWQYIYLLKIIYSFIVKPSKVNLYY